VEKALGACTWAKRAERTMVVRVRKDIMIVYSIDLIVQLK
jgi:hypothetical protein